MLGKSRVPRYEKRSEDGSNRRQPVLINRIHEIYTRRVFPIGTSFIIFRFVLLFFHQNEFINIINANLLHVYLFNFSLSAIVSPFYSILK